MGKYLNFVDKNVHLSNFFKQVNNNSKYYNFIFIYPFIFFLSVEVLINNVADFLVPQITSSYGILLFVVIAIISGISQYYLILRIRKNQEKTKKKQKIVKNLFTIIIIFQLILYVNIMIILSGILIFDQYHLYNLIFSNIMVGFISIFLLIFFTYKFFIWYRKDKNSHIVLLFGTSFLLLTIALTMVHIGNVIILLDKNTFIINSLTEVIYPDFEESSFFEIFFDIFIYLETISFILMVVSNFIMLKNNNSIKISRLKLYSVISIPIILTLSSSLDAFNIYETSTSEDLFGYYLFTSFYAFIGGIIFGTSFWLIGKNIKESITRNFINLAAYGFIFTFISIQPTIATASYPPYGLITLSVMPLAIFLIFYGVYNSAISISQDNSIRRNIRKMITNQKTNLFGSIGTIEIENNLNQIVSGIKDIVEKQENELQSESELLTNISQDDTKKYMQQVIEEMKKSKKNGT